MSYLLAWLGWWWDMAWNLRHYLTCRPTHPRCLLCRHLEWSAHQATEGDWKWYIIIAWVMLCVGITRG